MSDSRKRVYKGHSVRRIGKPLSDVAWYQEDFIQQDSDFLSQQRCLDALYKSGPNRETCILCQSLLQGPAYATRDDITYRICVNCGHLNGNHLITEELVDFAYGSVGGNEERSELHPYVEEYAHGKMSREFHQVVDRIYQPKANFLCEVLAERIGHGALSDLKLLDAGCGPGHFLRAAQRAGFIRPEGVETLPAAIKTAASFGIEPIALIKGPELGRFMESRNWDVVSMMCVLPHLPDPISALQSMKAGGVRWTFQRLPMWSLAVLMEFAFPESRARVLSGDHTHLFTWDSISWLERHFNMRRVGVWSFGSDARDLLRKTVIGMEGISSPAFLNLARTSLDSVTESIQLAVDQAALSAEVHLVWEFVDNTE